MSLKVLMLPSARGFVKKSLADLLESKGFNVEKVEFANAAEQRTVESRARNILIQHNGPVIMHGWSQGGGVALRLASEGPTNLIGLALYAAGHTGGAKLFNIECPTMYYHNKHDEVIHWTLSQRHRDYQNSRKPPMQQKASMYKKQEWNMKIPGTDNHQCDEFNDACVDWMLSVAQTVGAIGQTPTDEKLRTVGLAPFSGQKLDDEGFDYSEDYANWVFGHENELKIVSAWETLERLGFTVTPPSKPLDAKQIKHVEMSPI